MAYVKLKRQDQWGYISYTFNGDEVRFSNNQKVHVEWPDKHRSVEKIVMERYENIVQDMGHSYEVSGRIPTIVKEMHGLELVLHRLDFLKIRESDLKMKK